ncbi:uncharacterized protein TNCT_611231 [Trichonephila clavata]|uniref:Uncharacterized protein n=1 Tax=Trichonephila clavata TaxID=2740835 RepID=A0A8X6EY37_TRICU|nr:uncharacterized protein TNCT_86041 [Trichonephila clavata]GFQ94865.1 uncharacterized protein TNCT_611231 [Trichonephila clavata]
MAHSQKKLNVNVSFDSKLAQYLTEMAEIQNKTIPEVLVGLVEEEFEEDVELSEIADDRLSEGRAMAIKHEERIMDLRKEEAILEYRLDLAKEEGRKEREIEVAKNLLKAGVSIDIIAQTTGLSMKELQN